MNRRTFRTGGSLGVRVNRRNHLTDITIKLYKDGYKLRCQCGKFEMEQQNRDIVTALQNVLIHSRECERMSGSEDGTV